MNEPVISPWLFYIGYLSKAVNILLAFAIIIAWYSICAYLKASDNFEFAKKDHHMALTYLKMRQGGLEENKSSIAYKTLYESSLSNYNEAAQKEEEAKALLDVSIPKCRKGIVAALALVIVWAIIPNEETIYRMALAKVVTPNNLQITGETVESIIDKAVDKIIKIKEAQ